ncbi:MAG: type IV restriction endonuclease, partial [Actinomycetes bacterium]
MAAPDAVLELVERFARNRVQYLNPAYNETQVRREFLDPFFAALGWDVDNAAGHAQQYKDVVHEDAIKVGLDSRAPDYSFRIGGQRKFFVE